jgi:hypothetical protein
MYTIGQSRHPNARPATARLVPPPEAYPARTERDRLVAERTALEEKLAEARTPLTRLDAVIAGADWAAGKRAHLEAEHDHAVGEAMAAGRGDPQPSGELLHARAEADLMKKRAETAARARPAHETAVQQIEAALGRINSQIGDIDAAAEIDLLAREYEQFVAEVQQVVNRWVKIETHRRQIIIAAQPAAMGRLSQLDRTIAVDAPAGVISSAYEICRNLFSAVEARGWHDPRPSPIRAISEEAAC